MKSTSRIRVKVSQLTFVACLLTNKVHPCLSILSPSPTSPISRHVRLHAASSLSSPSSSPSISPTSRNPLDTNTYDVHNYKNQSQKHVEGKLLHLSRTGKTLEALSLYRSVWDLDEEILSSPSTRSRRYQCKPTTRFMNHAIDACARSFPPRVEEAFEIYNNGIVGGKSGTRRLCPNVYTFGALVSVCGRAGLVEKCTSLIQQMKVSFTYYVSESFLFPFCNILK